MPEASSAESGETLEGRVVQVLAEEELLVAEQMQPVQRVVVEITRGSLAGQRIEMLHWQATALTEMTRVQPGNHVLLEHAVGPDGELFYITDVVRWPALLGLTLLFGLAALAVGGWVGLRALVSMCKCGGPGRLYHPRHYVRSRRDRIRRPGPDQMGRVPLGRSLAHPADCPALQTPI